MRKFIYSFLLLGSLHLAYGFFVSFWRPSIYSRILTSTNSQPFYDYAGAFNVKTNKSSGSGALEDVLSAARSADMDFIILSDFNNFTINPQEHLYINNIIVFNGGEYSYLDSRILNFDMQTVEHLQGPGRSQVAFADLLSHTNETRPEGAFVLAHPPKNSYQLKDPYPEGLDGIELINLKQIWKNTWLNSKFSFFWTMFLYPFNSNLAYVRMLARTDEETLAVWDRLVQGKPTYGFYGISAEAKMRITGDIYLKFPSYETLFSIVKNHILLRSELTGNATLDRKKISEALRAGQFYMSLDILQNPKGFNCYIIDENRQARLPGAQMDFHKGQELVVNLPEKPEIPFEIMIYRNGEKIATANSASTTLTLHSPGVYRAAVRLKVPLPPPDGAKWLNWILTNPFYVN